MRKSFLIRPSGEQTKYYLMTELEDGMIRSEFGYVQTGKLLKHGEDIIFEAKDWDIVVNMKRMKGYLLVV